LGRFQADFDIIGLGLTLAAGMLLMYFGLSFENFAANYWVAYAFWVTGFFGSLVFGFAKRSKTLKPTTLLTICAFVGLIVLAFSGINFAYSQMPLDAWSERVGTAGVGISEEIFFGVFLLGLLINWLGLNKVLAVVVSAAVHSGYHVFAYGTDIKVLSLFFVCFTFARAVYVFLYPKVGVLVGAHGLWNFIVSGGAVVKQIGDLAVAWVSQRLEWLGAV
jgi:hypothetical protein